MGRRPRAARGRRQHPLATCRWARKEGLEEERRLFYVALTRPRRALHVYFPLRYHHHRGAHDDKHSWAQPSRFLDAGVLAVMDQISLGCRPAGGALDQHQRGHRRHRHRTARVALGVTDPTEVNAVRRRAAVARAKRAATVVDDPALAAWPGRGQQLPTTAPHLGTLGQVRPLWSAGTSPRRWRRPPIRTRRLTSSRPRGRAA